MVDVANVTAYSLDLQQNSITYNVLSNCAQYLPHEHC